MSVIELLVHAQVLHMFVDEWSSLNRAWWVAWLGFISRAFGHCLKFFVNFLCYLGFEIFLCDDCAIHSRPQCVVEYSYSYYPLLWVKYLISHCRDNKKDLPIVEKSFLVAGAGFEPATLWLWATRANRAAPPRGTDTILTDVEEFFNPLRRP